MQNSLRFSVFFFTTILFSMGHDRVIQPAFGQDEKDNIKLDSGEFDNAKKELAMVFRFVMKDDHIVIDKQFWTEQSKNVRGVKARPKPREIVTALNADLHHLAMKAMRLMSTSMSGGMSGGKDQPVCMMVASNASMYLRKSNGITYIEFQEFDSPARTMRMSFSEGDRFTFQLSGGQQNILLERTDDGKTRLVYDTGNSFRSFTASNFKSLASEHREAITKELLPLCERIGITLPNLAQE